MRVTYDGGKVMAGYGMFTGTSSAAWVMMSFGYKSCGGTKAVIVPTGYATLTTNAGTTAVLCATRASWIWFPSTVSAAEQRSTMVTDIAESWVAGSTLVANTTTGSAPILYAIGGVNYNLSFGLGIWNSKVWGIF